MAGDFFYTRDRSAMVENPIVYPVQTLATILVNTQLVDGMPLLARCSAPPILSTSPCIYNSRKSNQRLIKCLSNAPMYPKKKSYNQWIGLDPKTLPMT